MSNSTITENDVLLVYLPHIKRICCGRWFNIEPEDRISEASLYFIYALRTFSLNCGHFWNDYCNGLMSYMDQLNRITPSRYFKKEYSLDSQISTKNAESKMTLFDILEGVALDESSLSVESFIETLSSQDQNIIHDLMAKMPRALVARKYNLSIHSLKRRLNEIGDAYIEG